MDKFDARQATLDLVTAFVNHNSLKARELPALLSEVYGAIAGFDGKETDPAPQDNAPVPHSEPASVSAPPAVVEGASNELKAAVSIEESLSDPNYIVSMITGEKLKTLTRHLRRHGLDEQQYRERFDLPQDYPMVAPAYSEFRREVAKKMSLGRVGRAQPAKDLAPSAVPEGAPPAEAAPVKAEQGAKTPAQKTSSGKRTAKSNPEAVAAKAETAPFSPPAPKAEPKRRAKVTAKQEPTDTAASTPAPLRQAEPAAKGDTAQPTKRARKAKDAPASPDAASASVKGRRPRARPAASDVLQKAGDAASAPVKTRRSKLTPVFSD